VGRQEMGQECEGISRKWVRSVRGSVRSWEGVCEGQQEVGQEFRG